MGNASASVRLNRQTAGENLHDNDASLEQWIENTRREIAETRKMVNYWLGELEGSVEGEDVADPKRDEHICERTRMVVVAGETLHNMTSVFVRWSEEPAPEEGWDPSLAAQVDRLLEMAAEQARTEPFKTNCRERLAYARESWQRWCPDFAETLAQASCR